MKKLLASALALVTAFSLCACSAEKTTPSTAGTIGTIAPEGTQGTTETTGTKATTATTGTSTPSAPTDAELIYTVNKALIDFRVADSFRAQAGCTMTMKYGNTTTEENVSMSISAKNLKTAPEWLKVSRETTEYGTNENSVYFKDNCFYASKCGLNGKIRATGSAKEELGYKKMFDSFIAEIPQDTSKVKIDSIMSSNAAQTKKWRNVTITVKDATVLLDDYYELMKESFVSDDESMQVNVSAPSEEISLRLDESGKLLYYRATISVKITVSGGGATASTTVKTVFDFSVDDMNGNVAVEAPENLDLYVDTTEKEFGYTFFDLAYQDFIGKNDFEASSSCSIGVQMLGVNMSINMSGRLWANDFNTKSPILRETAVMEIVGQSSAKTDFYLKNGYYYVSAPDAEGNETRVKLSEKEYEALYGAPDFTVIRMFGDTDFYDYEVEKNEYTGNTEIIFAMNPWDFKLQFAQDIDTVKTIVVGTQTVTDTEIYDAQVLATLTPDGKLYSYEVYYVMEMTVIIQGRTTSIVCEVNDVTTIGSTENVTVPEIPNISSFGSLGETV